MIQKLFLGIKRVRISAIEGIIFLMETYFWIVIFCFLSCIESKQKLDHQFCPQPVCWRDCLTEDPSTALTYGESTFVCHGSKVSSCEGNSREVEISNIHLTLRCYNGTCTSRTTLQWLCEIVQVSQALTTVDTFGLLKMFFVLVFKGANFGQLQLLVQGSSNAIWTSNFQAKSQWPDCCQ
jgi:hypothetical protein